MIEAAELEIGEPFIRNFEPKEYGGHTQVWSIAEDQRGVMYFGTTEEILEYDGKAFRAIRNSNNSIIRSLASGPDGRIYVGGIEELGYLAPNREGLMTYHSLTNDVPKEHRDFKDVWQTIVTGHGVYFLCRDRTFRWQGGEMEVLPFGNFSALKLGEELYLSPENEIWRVSGGKRTAVPGSAFDKETYGRINLFPSWNEQEILVVSEKKGLFIFSILGSSNSEGLGKIRKFENEVDEYLIQNNVYSRAYLKNGTIALGTLAGGIVVLDSDGTLVQIVNEKRGLASNAAGKLYEDRFGNLWVATNKGISHISMSSPVTLFGNRSGINSYVLSITRHQGEIYAGTQNQGPLLLAPYELEVEGNIPAFKPIDGQPIQYGWDFLSIGDSLLVSSMRLRRIQNGKVTDIEETPVVYDMCKSTRFPGRIYLGIAEQSDGGLGVLVYRDDVFEFKGKLTGIEDVVRLVQEDEEGNLWVSTQMSGLIHMKFKSGDPDDFEVVRYTTEHGLPAMNWNKAFVDGDQVLVATKDGVYRYVSTPAVSDKPIHFLPVYRCKGNGKKEGDDYYRIYDLRKYGENSWLTDPLKKYGILERRSDGTYYSDARPFQIIPLQLEKSHVDKDGVAWISTVDGICRYDPNVQKDYDAPFSALIRNVKTKLERKIFQGTYYDPASKHDDHYNLTTLAQPGELVPTLSYEENGITFEFSALFYENSEETEYQYRLTGTDDKWSEWSDKTLKEYNSLWEGSYEFQVRAKNLYDTVSDVASYRFKILPPWYRTVKMYGAYLFGFVLLFLGGIRLSTWRLNAAKRRLEKIVRRRTREVVRQRDEIEEARNALWSEMELAKKIQTVLLPKDPRIPGYEITGYMQPADEVGGDYYDVINVGDRNWLVIGDVSGHGVTAGLVMMMVHTAFDLALREPISDSPDKILESVNRTIYRDIRKLGEDKYMTVTLMSLEPDGTVHFSGLHQDLMIYRKAERQVESIETEGIWLGMLDDTSGMNAIDSLHLEPGDTMLLFTDGIVEARDGDDNMFGQEKLTDVFERFGDESTKAIIERIMKSLKDFKTDDDVTILVVKRDD